MKLKDKELTEIVNIVEKYSFLQEEFSEIEKKMQEVREQKDDLLIKLEAVRTSELELMKLIEQKYGPGQLNLNTYEYIREND